MRTKKEILDNLYDHAQKLDPQHYQLAAVAMIETEVQVDIRDYIVFIAKMIVPGLLDDRHEP